MGSAAQIFLGTVAPTEAEIEQVVMAYRDRLNAQWSHLPWSRYESWMRTDKRTAKYCLEISLGDPDGSFKPLAGRGLTQEENRGINGILPYSPYIQAVKNINGLKKRHAKGEFFDIPEVETLLTLPFDDRKYTSDFDGWLNYLQDQAPQFTTKLRSQKKRLLFPAHPRKFHTHIAAPNGWGKSELLKALAFHDIQHDAGSLIVIEPIGRMVGQIARFPELAGGDRLVLLQPELTAGQYPCLNPLEVHGFNATQKASYAETLAGALALIADNPLTSNMTLVATACIRVLLDRPGSTLSDLVDMLDEPETARKGQPTRPSLRTPLLRLGEAHRDPEVAKFFRYRFDASNLKTSKSGLSVAARNRTVADAQSRGLSDAHSVRLELYSDARSVRLSALSVRRTRDHRCRRILGETDQVGRPAA